MEPEVLYYSLLAKQETMKVLSHAATLGIMNQETTRQIEIAVPKLEEQFEIVKYLQSSLGKNARVIKKTEQVIDRLTEYRTALITATVTGQLTV
jgi:type I restriction enzyme S subunit